ncbi:hypothetical protein ABBQ32_010249 [Trebouxia sp. C0010 RCD-2024]
MPDTRNIQHPQQRPLSGGQRPRRHVQPPPQRCQNEDGLTNLQSVLVNTAPCFPASNQGSCCEAKSSSDFNLEALWGAYEAWSAYGAEVPLAVPSEAASQVTQCYVPYLSGLQLFEHSPTVRRLHHCTYTSDEDWPDSLNSDLTSMGSSMESVYTDSDSEDGKDTLTATHDRFSVLRKGTVLGDPSRLLFEFFESTSPHEREPFTDRIQQLAAGCCPELLTLNSSSLHPSSWYSVAWYPLYRFPSNGSSLRELNASFLTFHSMSASPTAESPCSTENRPQPPQMPLPAQQALAARQAAVKGGSASDAVVLEAFAFMPYKLHGYMWSDPAQNKSVYEPMMGAAETWVQRRRCKHPDLHFFAERLQPLPQLRW